MIQRTYKPFMYRGEEIHCGWKPLFVEERCHSGSAPTPPDPNVAAIQGIQTQAANYPFQYLINSLAQTGGNATLTNPVTGQPQNYDFTGLGTADVQNQVSGQMAQVLLDIQNGLGSQYIAQRLRDLQQADPTGYAAYGQLFNQIQQEAAQAPPNQPLSQSTQSQIQNLLQNSNTLSPEELNQVQQTVRGGNVASGVYLGNAPQQAEASAVVNALDQQRNAAEAQSAKYLSEGITPSDIQFRKIQQDMANLGAFISGQNPQAEFSSLSGAQQQAAPYPQTGYTPPTINEGAAARGGIGQANQLFGIQNELASSQANPYLAGLNFGLQGLGFLSQSSMNPFSMGGIPQSQTNAIQNEMLGIGIPGLTGSGGTGTTIPDVITPINTGSIA